MSLKKVASTQPSHRIVDVPSAQGTDSIQLSVVKRVLGGPVPGVSDVPSA
jgi:hypothetical protein